MNIEKSYTISDVISAEVAQIISEGELQYSKIAHIVLESEIDAGAFFEHELIED